ncbi:hypothetical protein Dda_0216 [Drechslerella dactyloides]|uniref:Uncharacterized protein n=1 Tax=Drechslerella dactyloides TaxID=74499 RepID=A0AAD6J681_DREDA|nr:hypothetical protein Dda_0216 [Drechslerella dactyloides]
MDPSLAQAIRQKVRNIGKASSVASRSASGSVSSHRSSKASERYRARKRKKAEARARAAASDTSSDYGSEADSEVSSHSAGSLRSAFSDDDEDDDDDTASALSCGSYTKRENQVVEQFIFLPPKLREIETNRLLENKQWKEDKNLRTVKNAPTSVAEHFARLGLPSPLPQNTREKKAAVKVKESLGKVANSRRGRKRVVEDVKPMGSIWEDPYIEIGSRNVRRIDLRNFIVIDPTAPVFPEQPMKFLSLSEIGSAYQFYLELEIAREAKRRGKEIRKCFAATLKMERIKGTQAIDGNETIGPTDKIPFDEEVIIHHPRELIPAPPFIFLDLVRVTAPEYLPSSDVNRPYDWIPRNVGRLDMEKSLPAIYWSASDREAAAVVFYIFDSKTAINDPVSIGVVDGDQGVANISINTCRFMSSSRKKVFWSGYIDFSRPMIVPFENIHSINESARANEQNFWDIWKCLFKKPSYGGHQYGMTTATRPFENPYRLMQLFESKQQCYGKYTEKMMLDKPPARMRETDTSDEDSNATIRGKLDSTDDGDVSTITHLTDDDDVQTVIFLGEEADKPVANQSQIENAPDPTANTTTYQKPSVTSWLEAVFDRPPAISLDENVMATKPHLAPKNRCTLAYPQCYEPLAEITVKELGHPIAHINKTYNNPEDYVGPDKNQHKESEGLDNEKKLKRKYTDLNGFERRLLEMINECIGSDGKSMPFSSWHTGYLYHFPSCKNTKEFLQQYVAECIEVAKKAEIAETGKTTLDGAFFPWDELFHPDRAEEIDVRKVLEVWEELYPPGSKVTDKIDVAYEKIVKAVKADLLTIPAKWLPRELLMTVRLHDHGMVKRKLKPWQSKDEIPDELPAVERWKKAHEIKEIRYEQLLKQQIEPPKDLIREGYEKLSPQSLKKAKEKKIVKEACGPSVFTNLDSEVHKSRMAVEQKADIAVSQLSKKETEVPPTQEDTTSLNETTEEINGQSKTKDRARKKVSSEATAIHPSNDSTSASPFQFETPQQVTPTESLEPERESPENPALATEQDKSAIANRWLDNLKQLKKKKQAEERKADIEAEDDRGYKYKVWKIEQAKREAERDAAFAAMDSRPVEVLPELPVTEASSEDEQVHIRLDKTLEHAQEIEDHGPKSSENGEPETPNIPTEHDRGLLPKSTQPDIDGCSFMNTLTDLDFLVAPEDSSSCRLLSGRDEEADIDEPLMSPEENLQLGNVLAFLKSIPDDPRVGFDQATTRALEIGARKGQNTLAASRFAPPELRCQVQSCAVPSSPPSNLSLDSDEDEDDLKQGNANFSIFRKTCAADVAAWVEASTPFVGSYEDIPEQSIFHKTTPPKSRIPVLKKSPSPTNSVSASPKNRTPTCTTPPSGVRPPRHVSAARIPLPISRPSRSSSSSPQNSPPTGLLKRAMDSLASKVKEQEVTADQTERQAKIRPVQIPTVFKPNAKDGQKRSPKRVITKRIAIPSLSRARGRRSPETARSGSLADSAKKHGKEQLGKEDGNNEAEKENLAAAAKK